MYSRIVAVINSNIINLYGEEILRDLRRYGKLRSKRSKLLCNLTYKTKNILKRASLALTKAIQDSRRDIDKVNSELLKLYLTLSNKVHPTLWNIFDKLTNFRSETDADLTKEKHIKKFEKMILQQRPKNKEVPTTESSNLVYNFSNLTLDEAINSVLFKGFNFAIALRRIPVKNIISEVETTITKLPSETAEIIRQDLS
ncbi:uncharacterized protein [Diabrotica undecimpunctata]|uniref:uncharacterized protein n=1 Tax=Diabrotica undecimpunctata TaxID=50387 RepID=UPI003B63BF87